MINFIGTMKILQFPLYRKENFLLIENQDDLEKIPEFIKENTLHIQKKN